MHKTFTEHARVVQLLAPASRGAGTTTTDWIKHAHFRRAAVLVNLGAVTATGTLDVKIQEADDNGSGAPSTAADVTNGAFAQKTDTSGIGIYAIDLDIKRRKEWVRCSCTVATAAVVYGIEIVISNFVNSPTTNPTRSGSAGGSMTVEKQI